MARVKRSVTSRPRRKKVLKQAKGYRGRSHTSYRVAKGRVEKGLQYAYRDRRTRKRSFRALWIQRINAAARGHGLTYGRFMSGLRCAGFVMMSSVPGLSETARICSAISAGPPSWYRTIPARISVPSMPVTNWSKSVTTTPQRPEATV